MSITDELREQLLYHTPAADAAIQRLLDRIDAEHMRAMADARNEAMVKLGWLRLPKDADGEYIHIGDVMDNTHKRGFAAKPVIGISYHEGGKMCVRVDEDELRWHDPLKLHHHHEPTVEDVLREFVERLDEIGSEDDCCGVDEQECRACIRQDIAAAYAEYAEKLREVVEHERE